MKDVNKIRLKPTITLSEENANLIMQICEKERRNLSNFIAYILEDYIAHYKKTNANIQQDLDN